MNIIRSHSRSRKKIICYTQNSPGIVKTKQGGVFLQISNLISSIKSYKKVLISYPQS